MHSWRALLQSGNNKAYFMFLCMIKGMAYAQLGGVPPVYGNNKANFIFLCMIKGMAYAQLAGIPPVYGLYTSFLAPLLYLLLGRPCFHF